MTKSLFYIQLGKKEDIAFGHPLGAVRGWQVYDLDNHSDATTLQYARRLLDEASEVVLVFQQHSSHDSLGGVAGFLETLVRQKATVTAYTIGQATLPALVKNRFRPQETTLQDITALLAE